MSTQPTRFYSDSVCVLLCAEQKAQIKKFPGSLQPWDRRIGIAFLSNLFSGPQMSEMVAVPVRVLGYKWQKAILDNFKYKIILLEEFWI